jgi:hypothetical protein
MSVIETGSTHEICMVFPFPLSALGSTSWFSLSCFALEAVLDLIGVLAFLDDLALFFFCRFLEAVALATTSYASRRAVGEGGSFAINTDMMTGDVDLETKERNLNSAGTDCDAGLIRCACDQS